MANVEDFLRLRPGAVFVVRDDPEYDFRFSVGGVMPTQEEKLPEIPELKPKRAVQLED